MPPLSAFDNIYDDVVLRLEVPDLVQDHEGSLQQPDYPPLVLEQGAHYAQPIWSGSGLREGVTYNLTALLPFSKISELDISS